MESIAGPELDRMSNTSLGYNPGNDPVLKIIPRSSTEDIRVRSSKTHHRSTSSRAPLVPRGGSARRRYRGGQDSDGAYEGSGLPRGSGSGVGLRGPNRYDLDLSNTALIPWRNLYIWNGMEMGFMILCTYFGYNP